VAEVVAILAEDPGAKLIAGGTDLGVESNLRWSRWTHLVSLEAVEELRVFAETAERVTIGAALPLSDLLLRWKDAPAAIGECLLPFASPTIRNRATLGGNLGNASPIGDSAPLLMALDAEVRVVGPAGTRSIALSSFFAGFRRTVLTAGEFIAAIEIPKPFPQLARFFKVSKRRMDDISTVAAGMAVSFDQEKRVSQVRLAFGGVADRTLRAMEAEDAMIGRPWNLQTVQLAQSALARTLKPMSDHRGSADYRMAVAQSLLERFWYE
jgi:xanthine dehydrogenase small subunit